MTTTDQILRAAVSDRSRQLTNDVPRNLMVGRASTGLGVAWRNFAPAWAMPFPTSTRQLRAGFLILTDAEAAAIALDHLDAVERRAQADADRWDEQRAALVRVERPTANGPLVQWVHPEDAERVANGEHARRGWYGPETIERLGNKHRRRLAEIAKLRVKCAKLVAAAQPAEAAEPAEVLPALPVKTRSRAVEAGRKILAPKVEARKAELEAEGRKAAELQAKARMRATLEANAIAARQAQQLLETTIRAAAELGLGDREIGRLVGLTHPTVAKLRRAS